LAEILRAGLIIWGFSTAIVSGRPKHLWLRHLPEDAKDSKKEFQGTTWLHWIIVQSNDECYRALAAVHDAFRPIPGRRAIGLFSSTVISRCITAVVSPPPVVAARSTDSDAAKRTK